MESNISSGVRVASKKLWFCILATEKTKEVEEEVAEEVEELFIVTVIQCR
jgi:hypothetical protein